MRGREARCVWNMTGLSHNLDASLLGPLYFYNKHLLMVICFVAEK